MLFNCVCLCLADPATFTSFSPGDLIFLGEQLVYSYVEKNNNIFMSLYYDFINTVNIKILNLNFFSKTTECPFKICAPPTCFYAYVVKPASILILPHYELCMSSILYMYMSL